MAGLRPRQPDAKGGDRERPPQAGIKRRNPLLRIPFASKHHPNRAMRSTRRSKNVPVSRSTPTSALAGRSVRSRVDDRAAAAELRLGLDLDVPALGPHEVRADRLGDGYASWIGAPSQP